MMRAIILQATTMRPSIFVALALPILLAACVYRMNIQQGNYLESKAVDQVKDGMTRSQVRYLLGTPMMPDAFDNERWDYVYYLKKGRLKAPEQHRLVVHFQDDKVTLVDRVSLPKGTVLPMPDPQQAAPAANAPNTEASHPATTQPTNPGATQPGSPPPPPPAPQPAEPPPAP